MFKWSESSFSNNLYSRISGEIIILPWICYVPLADLVQVGGQVVIVGDDQSHRVQLLLYSILYT